MILSLKAIKLSSNTKSKINYSAQEVVTVVGSSQTKPALLKLILLVLEPLPISTQTRFARILPGPAGSVILEKFGTVLRKTTSPLLAKTIVIAEPIGSPSDPQAWVRILVLVEKRIGSSAGATLLLGRVLEKHNERVR